MMLKEKDEREKERQAGRERRRRESETERFIVYVASTSAVPQSYRAATPPFTRFLPHSSPPPLFLLVKPQCRHHSTTLESVIAFQALLSSHERREYYSSFFLLLRIPFFPYSLLLPLLLSLISNNGHALSFCLHWQIIMIPATMAFNLINCVYIPRDVSNKTIQNIRSLIFDISRERVISLTLIASRQCK